MTPSVFPIGGWASEKVKLDLGTPKTSGGVSRFHHCWHTHLAWSENKGCHGTPTFHALCIIFPYIFPRKVPLFSHWESHNSWAIPVNPPFESIWHPPKLPQCPGLPQLWPLGGFQWRPCWVNEMGSLRDRMEQNHSIISIWVWDGMGQYL